jgi:hypothetical protein
MDRDRKDATPISGERSSDFEEEIGVVAVGAGHSVDDLDLVVDALGQIERGHWQCARMPGR